LTKNKNPLINNLDCDVKIYFHIDELERLKLAIKKHKKEASIFGRYWLISQKI